ncbi:MAG: hypothetical protein WD069_10330 [Planctomycetales bacterium]
MAARFASRLALIAFAAATIRGLLEGADFQGTLTTGLAAVAVFYGLGLVLGDLSRKLVEEHAQAEFARSAERRGERRHDRTPPEPA